MSEVKLLLGAGILLLIALMGIGIFTSSQGDKTRDEYRSMRQQQKEMFDQALSQARQAQEMARMHMDMQRAAMMEAYGEQMGDPQFALEGMER